MANVLFNTYCNRSCGYCFAKEKIDPVKNQKNSAKNISMDALEKIIDFYKRSQLARFVILGGEPTLHPDFEMLIERVLKEKSLASLMIFSNGLMPETALNYLSNNTDKRIQIALNLNSPKNHTASQWEHVNRTMSLLGSRVGVGINIYQPRQDYDYLIDAILKHNLTRHIRVGITHPVLGSNNLYAREEDLPAIAEDIVSLAKKTYQHGIGFSFDCGFRFCMFSLEQHKELLTYAVKFKSVCSPIIDVGPDLSVWHCFPLTNKVNRRLEDFKNRNEMVDFYQKTFKSYLNMGNTMDCPNCRYRINDLCNGGCLARTISAFNSKG